jgi:hypothetical protein
MGFFEGRPHLALQITGQMIGDGLTFDGVQSRTLPRGFLFGQQTNEGLPIDDPFHARQSSCRAQSHPIVLGAQALLAVQDIDQTLGSNPADVPFRSVRNLACRIAQGSDKQLESLLSTKLRQTVHGLPSLPFVGVTELPGERLKIGR